MLTKTIETPIGPLTLCASDVGITNIVFGATGSSQTDSSPAISKAEQQLKEFFAGGRQSFDLKLDLSGLTEFQRATLSSLEKVPFGETRTYGELAEAIGKPKAARAVGGALNRNPIAIVLPCHRVVGSDGSLTGFAGGLDVKSQLLKLERA